MIILMVSLIVATSAGVVSVPVDGISVGSFEAIGQSVPVHVEPAVVSRFFQDRSVSSPLVNKGFYYTLPARVLLYQPPPGWSPLEAGRSIAGGPACNHQKSEPINFGEYVQNVPSPVNYNAQENIQLGGLNGQPQSQTLNENPHAALYSGNPEFIDSGGRQVTPWYSPVKGDGKNLADAKMQHFSQMNQVPLTLDHQVEVDPKNIRQFGRNHFPMNQQILPTGYHMASSPKMDGNYGTLLNIPHQSGFPLYGTSGSQQNPLEPQYYSQPNINQLDLTQANSFKIPPSYLVGIKLPSKNTEAGDGQPSGIINSWNNLMSTPDYGTQPLGAAGTNIQHGMRSLSPNHANSKPITSRFVFIVPQESLLKDDYGKHIKTPLFAGIPNDVPKIVEPQPSRSIGVNPHHSELKFTLRQPSEGVGKDKDQSGATQTLLVEKGTESPETQNHPSGAAVIQGEYILGERTLMHEKGGSSRETSHDDNQEGIHTTDEVTQPVGGNATPLMMVAQPHDTKSVRSQEEGMQEVVLVEPDPPLEIARKVKNRAKNTGDLDKVGITLEEGSIIPEHDVKNGSSDTQVVLGEDVSPQFTSARSVNDGSTGLRVEETIVNDGNSTRREMSNVPGEKIKVEVRGDEEPSLTSLVEKFPTTTKTIITTQGAPSTAITQQGSTPSKTNLVRYVTNVGAELTPIDGEYEVVEPERGIPLDQANVLGSTQTIEAGSPTRSKIIGYIKTGNIEWLNGGGLDNSSSLRTGAQQIMEQHNANGTITTLVQAPRTKIIRYVNTGGVEKEEIIEDPEREDNIPNIISPIPFITGSRQLAVNKDNGTISTDGPMSSPIKIIQVSTTRTEPAEQGHSNIPIGARSNAHIIEEGNIFQKSEAQKDLNVNQGVSPVLQNGSSSTIKTIFLSNRGPGTQNIVEVDVPGGPLAGSTSSTSRFIKIPSKGSTKQEYGGQQIGTVRYVTIPGSGSGNTHGTQTTTMKYISGAPSTKFVYPTGQTGWTQYVQGSQPRQTTTIIKTG